MFVNGEDVRLSSLKNILSLRDLIIHYKMEPEAVAADVNGSIPSRKTWSEIILKEEDRIELVRFVGGG